MPDTERVMKQIPQHIVLFYMKLCHDRQTLDVFVIVKVLFRIPQQLIIVKIRK